MVFSTERCCAGFYTDFGICLQKMIVFELSFFILFKKGRKLSDSDKEKCKTETRGF